jgi:hypothetical protein
VSTKAPGAGFIRSFEMKKMYKHILTALAVVCGIMLAACGNPAGGGENNGDDDPTNINFGKITATSTQEEVTNTIKLSLELLQSQTQNIINKLTEYQTSLQAQLQGKQPGTIPYDILLDKINVVKNVINYENQIKTAQQDRSTYIAMGSMTRYYASLTSAAANLIPEQANRDIFATKMSAYQGAVTLDERDIIGNTEKTNEFNALDSKRSNIIDLEQHNRNGSYNLPNVRTNTHGFRLQLENENKQTLNSIWGEYAPLFEGQTEDLGQYDAVLGNARALGKEVNLPRSVVQRLSVAKMVEEINAAPADAQADMVR